MIRRCTILAWALGAGLASAAELPTLQPDRPPPPPPPDRMPLEGPEVRENRDPGVPSRFTDGPMNEKGMRGLLIPPPAYVKIIDRMRADDAPDDIRLSPEQREQVREIMERARGEARNRGPGPDDRGPRNRGPRERGPDDRRPEGPEGMDPMPGDRPPPPPPPPPGERGPDRGPRGRQPDGEMRQVFTDAQQQVWAILTEPQREFVTREAEAVRHEREGKNAQQYVERRLNKNGKGPDGRPEGRPDGNPDRPGAGPDRERMERIRDMLMQLDPRDRAEILDRVERDLRARLDRGRGPDNERGGPRPKGRARRGGPDGEPGPRERQRDDRRNPPPPPPPPPPAHEEGGDKPMPPR